MKQQDTLSDREAEKKAKETIDVIEDGFMTKKTIHPGYKEFEDAKEKEEGILKKYNIKQYFGKFHYQFIKGDMRISMIKLRDRSLTNDDTKDKWFWEIHADEDKRLFSDCQRFPTKKAAMKEVIRLLGE